MEIICYACGKGEYPENTIEAIQHCQSVNPDWRIEMDLQITKDGEIVLFHDYNVKRITGLYINIFNMTMREIKKINAGYNFKVNDVFPYRKRKVQIPTLKNVFKIFPNAKYLLDIHTDNLFSVDKIIQIIEQNRMEHKVIIVSKYDEIVTSFKKKRPKWSYGASAKEVKWILLSTFFRIENLFSIKSDIIMLPLIYNSRKIRNERIVNYIRNKKKKIWIWMYEGEQVITIDSKDQLGIVQNKKIDGIFTSRPKKLFEEVSWSVL